MTIKGNIRTVGWRLLLLLFLFCSSQTVSYAQTENAGEYTEAHPLVYEDTWNLWPYSFLNENGEPDGFNIELVKLLMNKLEIPYVVRLKPLQEVLKDIKEHKADLTFGLAAGFHDDYGHFSRSTITLFTQSVVTPKSKSVEIKTFRDLSKATEKVYVYESSLCYHLIQDYGWGQHAKVSNNIKETLETVSKTQEGQVLWNTISLKWLIHQYNIKDVALTPVNMPHGEYKFMSNNQHLLDMLDHVYTKLDSDDKLESLENKWFYPEYDEAETPEWMWNMLWLALLLLGVALVYTVIYRIQNQRATSANNKLHRRLALIHETSAVRIWTFNVSTQEYAWHDEKGQITHTYRPEEFAQRYRQKDYQKLQDALNRLITQHKDKRGHVEEELTLELRAKDIEGGDHEWRDFVVVISVLQRDKKGKPSLIIGTKKDVTEKHRLKRLEDERTLRYWTIFYAPEGAIIEFDHDGYVHDINPTACELFQCDSDQIIKQHIHMNDFLHTSFNDLCQTDGYHTIQKYNDKNIEMQMKTVRQDDGKLLGVFAFCRQIVAMLLLLLVSAQVSAQALKDRYTKQRPVVIACEKNHKPYVFVDDNGKAAGSNIDVIKAVMKKLDVPYTFILKEHDEALIVFNSAEADIILADEQSFNGKQYVISEDVFGYRRISEDSVSEIHMIGRDRQLIEQIDDQYSRLKQSGDIAEIHARWIHPDQMKSRPVSVMLYIAVGILVLAVVLYLLITIARRHVTLVTRNSKELNMMMFKALHMGNYDIMQYDIARNRFTNRYGTILPKNGMTLEEYTQRIHPDQRAEFVQKMRNLISGTIPHFELNKRWNQGTDAEPHYLIFQGHAICERDLKGQPAFIINAVYDVTHDVEENQATQDLIRKYEVILTNPFTAMAFYDSDHKVIDQNEAMRQLGNISDEKTLQPLYNVDGEIANYFLAVSN